MEKKVVLVTGGSKGLGKSIIIEFAEKGYNVVINYNHSHKEAFDLESYIKNNYDVDVLSIKADVSDFQEVNNMIEKIIERWGHIDVVVNNAAIEENLPLKDKNKESFHRVLDVNLIGSFLVCQTVSKYMIKQQKGKIINISSNNSIDKFDSSTLEYDISKAGINLLTKALAKKYAPYINVNAVAPGWILTEKNELLNEQLDGKFIEEESKKILIGRFAEPSEIAKIVSFLASDDSDYINGQIIVADGGSY